MRSSNLQAENRESHGKTGKNLTWVFNQTRRLMGAFLLCADHVPIIHFAVWHGVRDLDKRAIRQPMVERGFRQGFGYEITLHEVTAKAR